jgi:hypothetical protein
MKRTPTFTVNNEFRAVSTFTVNPKNFDSDFADYEFERLRPSQGFEEFKKLISTIKNHFDLTIKRYDIQREMAIHSQRLKDLNELLSPFDYWEIWTSSEYCSFNHKEVTVINAFRKEGSIKIVSAKTGLTVSKINAILSKVARKLKYNSTMYDYKWWLSNQQLMLNRKDLFLNAPLDTLKNSIPMRILSVLCYIGDTLGEILAKVTEKELLSMRRMGKKGLRELKTVLHKYDCLDHLKTT